MTEQTGDGVVSPSMRVGRCEAEQDLYALLGVAPTASDATIRRAHRKLVLQHHPDLPGRAPGTDEKIKRVNLAASLLLNPGARARYDHLRAIGAHLRPTPPRPRSSPPPARRSVAPPRPSPFVGPRFAARTPLGRGAGISAKLFAFAFVATAAIGCLAQTTAGPVPVSSPSYRIPEGPQMTSLFVHD